MKKIILIFLIIVCSCGIGYLGYLIFNSKNIDKVELVGSVQTLYIVGDEIDFEDAQLKVTYKNGDINMVDLDSKSVEIQFFSTSVETHGKMNIVYKSAVIEVEYNVIQKGAYYLTNFNSAEIVPLNENLDNVNKSNKSYSISNTTEMIFVVGGGVCNYYNRTSGKWFMNDGGYNKNYAYTITGDVMTVKLDDKSYDIRVTYAESGRMIMSTKKLTFVENTELIRKQETRYFEHTDEMKTTQSVISAEVVHGYGSNLTTGGSIEFSKNEKLDDRDDVFLRITFAQYNSDHQFRVVYVKVHDSMVSRNFSTISAKPNSTYATLAYAGITDIELYYTVKN